MIFINYYTIDETCFHFFAKTCLFIYPTYAPSKPLVVQWVKTAWDAVGVDVIKKSFIVSGIALHPDGSEDNNIRCIQTNGVAAQAKEEITRQTALLTQDEDENDPFLDCEDDEELENNETVIDDDDN